MQKVHVEKCFRENSQKIDKNFDVSFTSTFLFYCVFRCYLAIEFKNTTKNVLQKIDKESTKNPKPIFTLFLFHVFWVFLGEGSSKTR
jgi:hypothetical protein